VPVPSDRSTAVLVTVGALGIAVTTALEVVTAPYSPAVSAYALNPAVHGAKVLAVIAFAAGFGALAGALVRRGERLAAVAAGVLAAGTVLGAAPYSVAETLVSPGLTPAAAEAELEATYAAHPWIGTVSSIVLPLVVLSLVVFAVVVLRRRLLPAWAPVASLAGIPLAVLAGVLGGAGWAVPHPPAWLFLGLSAYGVALLRRPAPVAVPA
jgi:hypothetical protein